MSVHVLTDASLDQTAINQGIEVRPQQVCGLPVFELTNWTSLPSVQNISMSLACLLSPMSTNWAALVITDIESGQSLEIHSPMSTAALKGCHEVKIWRSGPPIRRYLWVTAMEIVEHDALDATTGQRSNQKAKALLHLQTAHWITYPPTSLSLFKTMPSSS